MPGGGPCPGVSVPLAERGSGGVREGGAHLSVGQDEGGLLTVVAIQGGAPVSLGAGHGDQPLGFGEVFRSCHPVLE